MTATGGSPTDVVLIKAVSNSDHTNLYLLVCDAILVLVTMPHKKKKKQMGWNKRWIAFVPQMCTFIISQ